MAKETREQRRKRIQAEMKAASNSSSKVVKPKVDRKLMNFKVDAHTSAAKKDSKAISDARDARNGGSKAQKAHAAKVAKEKAKKRAAGAYRSQPNPLAGIKSKTVPKAIDKPKGSEKIKPNVVRPKGKNYLDKYAKMPRSNRQVGYIPRKDAINPEKEGAPWKGYKKRDVPVAPKDDKPAVKRGASEAVRKRQAELYDKGYFGNISRARAVDGYSGKLTRGAEAKYQTQRKKGVDKASTSYKKAAPKMPSLRSGLKTTPKIDINKRPTVSNVTTPTPKTTEPTRRQARLTRKSDRLENKKARVDKRVKKRKLKSNYRAAKKAL